MKIGIVGAGQLGRMMALAGLPMGHSFLFLDTGSDSPGAQVAPSLVGALDDTQQLTALATRCDVVTFDVENLPESATDAVTAVRALLPGTAALATAQDRLSEKRLFAELGIGTAGFVTVDSLDDLQAGVAQLGLPAVLKTRRLGYDGRGQRFLRQTADVDAAWRELGEVPMILEGFVDFDCEASLIGARSRSGEVRFYPLTCNVHWEGILDYSVAPADLGGLQATAEEYVGRLLSHFDYAGVLTVEFFVRGDTLLANEMAPRVHNSGHWTIEGAVTSQFENHLRGILDLPLGATAARGHAATVNLLGRMPDAAALLAIEGCHYHDYGKQPRPRRKLGHATVVAEDRGTLERQLQRLRDAVGPRA